jgi:hypothetical protein
MSLSHIAKPSASLITEVVVVAYYIQSTHHMQKGFEIRSQHEYGLLMLTLSLSECRECHELIKCALRSAIALVT